MRISNIINKLLDKLVLPYDKSLHFVYGFLISFLFTLVTTPLIGLIFTVSIALLKELFDYYSPLHQSSLLDAIFTIIPAVLLYIILLLK